MSGLIGGATADRLRPIALKTCKDVIGYEEGSIVAAATQCIVQNFTKEKAVKQLTPYLAQDTMQFVKALFDNVENADAVKSDERDSKSGRKRRFKDFEDIIEPAPIKAKKLDESTLKNLKSLAPGSENLAQQAIEDAKRQIANRKKFLKNLKPGEIAKVANIRTVSEEGLAKAKRAADLQARITQAMARQPGTLGVGAGPQPIILGQDGRRVDAVTGDIVEFRKATPSVLANQNVQFRDELKHMAKQTAKAKEETKKEWSQEVEEEDSAFKDNRINAKPIARRSRKFNFVEQGKYVREANQMRLKEKMKTLKEKIDTQTRETGIAQATALLAPRSRQEWELHVPEMEWWDTVITEDDFKFDNLIQHPEQKAPPGEAPPPDAIGLYLTKKERKKMRRLNRKEVQKEEQEKIRLGLLPVPEPKVKLANMMRVLDSAAVADPTKVERHVREQMAKRQKKHEQDNLARKLTDEQKREKKIKKLQEDTSMGVKVAIYRIRSLKDASKKFKIEMNSKQLYMTGVTILNPDCSVVIVEGGPKSQRKFKRLMVNRIKWEEDTIEYEDGNYCHLVWEGETPEAFFDTMIFKLCTTEALAREFFKERKCEHYWDLAHSKATITKVD